MDKRIIIPIELYSSKNSRQIFRTGNGRTIVAKSKGAKQNEIDLENILPFKRVEFLELLAGKLKPYRIQFKIYRKTARRFDYVNIVQNLLDAMVTCRWLEDDNADVMIPVFVPYQVDKYDPRVEIEVL